MYIFVICMITHGAQNLTITGNSNYYPFSWKEGSSLTGASIDLMKVICEEWNISVSTKPMEWHRSLHEVKKGRVDAIVTMSYTKDRAQFLEYSIPYTVEEIRIFVKKGNSFTFSQLSDLHTKKGVAIKEKVFNTKITSYLQYHPHFHRVQNYKEAFKKLNDGTIDFIIDEKNNFMYEQKKHQYGELFLTLPVPASLHKLHIAFSKKSPFVHLIPKINQKIASMQQYGVVQTLIDKSVKSVSVKKENEF